MEENTKVYGIYQVTEEFNPDGSYAGFRCSVGEATGKQGKLFVKTDGRENYQLAPNEETTSEDLEI
jgi:hypothetical protein